MPEWLTASFTQPMVDWRVLALRLATAALFGVVVSVIYRGTRDVSRESASFPGTLVLLCVLIAMVTQVIGDNVALAFSLVGALSIVRFRTAVRDTKDTAFVIFAVAVGMAIGAGQPLVCIGGVVATSIVAWLFRDAPSEPQRGARRTYDLTVRMASDAAAEPQMRDVLSRHGVTAEPVHGSTAKKGTALRIVYRTLLPPDAAPQALIRDLANVAGVQSVNLRQTRTEA